MRRVADIGGTGAVIDKVLTRFETRTEMQRQLLVSCGFRHTCWGTRFEPYTYTLRILSIEDAPPPRRRTMRRAPIATAVALSLASQDAARSRLSLPVAGSEPSTASGRPAVFFEGDLPHERRGGRAGRGGRNRRPRRQRDRGQAMIDEAARLGASAIVRVRVDGAGQCHGFRRGRSLLQ